MIPSFNSSQIFLTFLPTQNFIFPLKQGRKSKQNIKTKTEEKSDQKKKKGQNKINSPQQTSKQINKHYIHLLGQLLPGIGPALECD